jgi:hypothetical protein
MELMNNSFLNFKDIEFDGVLVKDYTDLSVLPGIPAKYYDSKYLMEYELQDNELIEGVSYNIYGTTNYWDLLIAGNGIKSLSQLPVQYDTVLVRAEERYSTFLMKPNLTGIVPTTEKKELIYQEILAEEIENNEKFRTLKYIRPEYISELLSDLQKLNARAVINEAVLIKRD